MKRMLAIFTTCICLICVGCVMPGDIEALRDAQRRSDDAVATQLKNLQDGTASTQEALTGIREAYSGYDRDVQRVEETVTARTEKLIDLINGLTTGKLTTAEMATGAGAISTAAVIGLNLYRNSTRRREIEQSIKGQST